MPVTVAPGLAVRGPNITLFWAAIIAYFLIPELFIYLIKTDNSAIEYSFEILEELYLIRKGETRYIIKEWEKSENGNITEAYACNL